MKSTHSNYPSSSSPKSMTIASLLEPASSLLSASSSGVILDRCWLQDVGDEVGWGVSADIDGVGVEEPDAETVGIDF